MNKNISYMILSPDAIEQKLLVPILLKLDEKNIEILKIKFKNIDFPILEALYGKQMYNMYPNWWVVEKLFSMGNSVEILLRIEDEEQDLSKILTELKGKSNPDLACEGTIRNEFRAENKVINLIHCPDDVDVCESEIINFFSVDEINHEYRQSFNSDIWLLEEKINGDTILDFYVVLCRVKRRILFLVKENMETKDYNNLSNSLKEELEYQRKVLETENRVRMTKEYDNILNKQCVFMNEMINKYNHSLISMLNDLFEIPYGNVINIYNEFERNSYEYGEFISRWELLSIQSFIANPMESLIGGKKNVENKK